MAITKINSLGVNLSSPLTFSAGTASLPSITFSGDPNTGVFSPTADTIGFTEGGTEAMRIDSSGNVGIGTTTPKLNANAGTFLSVIGTAGNGFIELGTTTETDGIGGAVSFNNTNIVGSDKRTATINALRAGANNTADLAFATNNAGTLAERMRINAAGALILAGSTAQKASGTTWSNPSDTRLKDNKQNYTKGLTELLQINVKTWEWNGKAGTTQGDVGVGIIADEIQTILPNTIDTYKAKLNENDTEETDVKRFDATEITWLLLNSVKEQQAIIEQLKARLTALESK